VAESAPELVQRKYRGEKALFLPGNELLFLSLSALSVVNTLTQLCQQKDCAPTELFSKQILAFWKE
jgi:hypothetical protein